MGQILLLADIHANALALAQVLRHAQRQGEIKQVWFLGDLLGYGPSPIEVLTQAAEVYQQSGWIIGNHDYALARLLRDPSDGLLLLSGVSELARRSWEFHRAQLQNAPGALAWYQAFVEHGQGPRFLRQGDRCVILTHGTLIRQEDKVRDALDTYGFPWLTPLEKRFNFLSPLNGEVSASRCLILYGHTHVPTCQAVQSFGASRPVFKELLFEYGRPISLKEHACVLLNPGSVGQPRDEDPRAAYALLDLESETVVFHRVPYPAEEVAAALIRLRWYQLAQRIMEASLARPRGQIGEEYYSILERRRESGTLG